MTNWNDFNNIEDNTNYGLIPNGTIAKVKMNIKSGGYNDEAQNWTGGYATKSSITGAIYLDAEFVILEGKYAKRKVWSLIGLHSLKGPEWSNMGRSFIKSMINSARGISAKDNSEKAVAARHVASFAELNGIEFVAKIDIAVDTHNEQKNEIKSAITPDHNDYAEVMGKVLAKPYNSQPQQAPIQLSNNNINNSNRPNWA